MRLFSLSIRKRAFLLTNLRKKRIYWQIRKKHHSIQVVTEGAFSRGPDKAAFQHAHGSFQGADFGGFLSCRNDILQNSVFALESEF